MDNIYYNGFRSGLSDKDGCPYGLAELNLRCRWLAGWHDYQIKHKTGRR